MGFLEAIPGVVSSVASAAPGIIKTVGEGAGVFNALKGRGGIAATPKKNPSEGASSDNSDFLGQLNNIYSNSANAADNIYNPNIGKRMRQFGGGVGSIYDQYLNQ